MVLEHDFSTETLVPAPLSEVFPFFSDAGNLMRLTPATLGFHILTPQPIPMHEGALIDYRIRLRGLPMRWRTRISRWNPPFEFIDEQLAGPYRKWVHRHTFEEAANGATLMRDHVRYALPLPPFGEIVLPFVRAEIAGIFEFRRRVLLELFPEKSQPA
jgi:ligand-binding SRPBCC domain-containing protein